jgi:hypothetical protein
LVGSAIAALSGPMMISLFARACFLGGGVDSTGCALSVGAEPSPSHATGAPDAGAQLVPTAQQLASINAAHRNKMDFKIIGITLSPYGAAIKKHKKQCHTEAFSFQWNEIMLQMLDSARFRDASGPPCLQAF